MSRGDVLTGLEGGERSIAVEESAVRSGFAALLLLQHGGRVHPYVAQPYMIVVHGLFLSTGSAVHTQTTPAIT